MLLKDLKFRVVADSSSHFYPVGSIISIEENDIYGRGENSGKYSGQQRAFRLIDLELVTPGSEPVVEDPKIRKIKLLKAQALILARVDCSGLDESKINRLVNFYVEALAQKIHPKMAMKAVMALAKVIA